MRSALFICWILLGCAVDVNAYRLALTRISNQDKINMDQWKYRLDKSDPQPVYRAKDKDYYKTEITIGTPEQKFQVVVTTSMPYLWVMDITCKYPRLSEECQDSKCDLGMVCKYFCSSQHCCPEEEKGPFDVNPCDREPYFISNNSSTYSKVAGRWSDMVGMGIFGNDTVRLGPLDSNPLTIPGAVFAQATEVPWFMLGVGGMLGLGLKEQAKSPFYPPFQRAIDLKLAEPFFTVYLNREAGYITYGEVDDEHCGKEMGSASLVSSKDYAIKVDAIAVGNTTFNTGWSFHLDMEGIAIVMPKAIADAIVQAVNAIPYEDGREYAFECDAACELTITINGIDYSLHVQDLSEPRYLNHCLLKIRGTDKSAEWMIGSGFMRRYCHIYDVEKKQVRFAPAVPQAELSSTTEQPGKLD
ncbi:hypothetical protein Q1695_004556 [Nippostrongylus brasiliensis]|nr:hypothetical protein Q1695_004556 [Nippostrongylus brasiliensis]